MKNSQLAIAAAGILLLAVGILRLAIPDRSRLRPLSVEAIHIPSQPIKSGQSIEQIIEWMAPEDVFIVGWGPRAKARNSAAEMSLFLPGPPDMLLFDYVEDGRAGRNEYAAPGTGVRLQKGVALRLSFRMYNAGPDAQTLGGSALIYFVPVAGN